MDFQYGEICLTVWYGARRGNPIPSTTYPNRNAAGLERPGKQLCSVPYATVTSLCRITSCIALSSVTPSCIGFWNALRPEIVMVDLLDERDLVRVAARHRTQHAERRSHAVAAALDREPDDIFRSK
jgi:hypothetical protein